MCTNLSITHKIFYDRYQAAIENRRSKASECLESRMINIIMIPAGAIATIVEIAFITLVGLANILTLGYLKKNVDFIAVYLAKMPGMLALNLVGMINPSFELSFKSGESTIDEIIEEEIANIGGGVTHRISIRKLAEIGDNLIISKESGCTGFVKRQIFSRIAYGTALILSPLMRVQDFIFGIFASMVAIVSCGTLPKVNAFVLKNMQITGVITDFFQLAAQVIYPRESEVVDSRGFTLSN